jgi:IS605 OrfB family transposase
MKKSIRIKKNNKGWFAELFFEKEEEYKDKGEITGIDCGYKKLMSLSNGEVKGEKLQNHIEKISRKKQGSKSFKKALLERNEYINKEIKSLNTNDIKTIVVEDLKDVKKKSKGKIRRKTMNKLQRWVYSYWLSKLEQFCQVVGVQYEKICPSYTSQTCSKCNTVDKKSRNGEIFKCTSCGYVGDADHNASLNILAKFLQRQEHMVPV